MAEQTKFAGNLQKVNTGEMIISLKDHLDNVLIKDIKSTSKSSSTDKIISNNKEFWTNAIQNQLILGQVIKLKNFRILEWIPSSPGLFFTSHAEQQRQDAIQRYRRRKLRDGHNLPQLLKEKLIELQPSEKMGMVQGGYGSLRVAPKSINHEIQHILCASSNGASHEGIAITLKQHHYEQLVTEIKNGKIPLANITGRVMILPQALSPVKLKWPREIPKFYLEIDDLKILSYDSSDNALVSIAITYAKRDDYFRDSSFSYSFCSFSPTKNNEDLKESVLWLQNYAERYSEDKTPIIVGDFDEQFEHFENVEFPIKDIANGRIPINKLLHFKELFHFQINEYYMGDKNIFNQSVIGAVGSNATSTNNTFQQINYAVPENLDYTKLSEELLLLKQELLKNANDPDHYKAISEVTSAEVASKEKNGSKAIKHLKDAGKWVLDSATKIGVNIVTELIKTQMNS